MNDIISQDIYGIMTRATAADAADQTMATYSYDNDTTEMAEISRTTNSLSPTGTAGLTVSLSEKTGGGDRKMHTVLTSTASATKMTAAGNG